MFADMGLGKTLQSICILASKHHERKEKHNETKSPDSKHLPSLIVCPPTLTGHWYYEILKYTENLRPVLYTGNSRERYKLLPKLKTYDVVVTSYEVVRNDITSLQDMDWHYCILDEGHIIKNAKTKLTKAVKQIKAVHRLILSGTPIQNNVLELWSLFDFLMPGFLGTESSFNERFSKPILSNRDGKAKTGEAGKQRLRSNVPFVDLTHTMLSRFGVGSTPQTSPAVPAPSPQGGRASRFAAEDHPGLLLRAVRAAEVSV